MKTTKTYANAIKTKYNTSLKLNQLHGDLYYLTPKNILRTCLNYLDSSLCGTDRRILEHYFNATAEANLRQKIKCYNLDGFKPICNFLKGKTTFIQSYDALELTALLVNFQPRPYAYYRNDKYPSAISKCKTENTFDDKKEIADHNIIIIVDDKSMVIKTKKKLKILAKKNIISLCF